MKLQLTAEQYAILLEEIPAYRVRELRGQSHLEAWDVRRTLIRVFGFGGWDLESRYLTMVREIEHPAKPFPNGDPGKPRWTVVYRQELRLVIKNPDGSIGAVFDGCAAGDSQNQPSLGDAHDMAMKTAESQALKRCASNLGDQFGLSLYNDGRRNAVVTRTLTPPEGTATAAELPRDEAPVKGEQQPATEPGPAPEPAPAPAPPRTAAPMPDGRVEARLRAQLAAASDRESLGEVWKAINTAGAAGAVAGEMCDQLKAAWQSRKAQVVDGSQPEQAKTPANDPKRRRMYALLAQAELAGDRDAKLAYVSDAAGREVGSTNQLTDTEVRQVCDRLERYLAQQEPVGAAA